MSHKSGRLYHTGASDFISLFQDFKTYSGAHPASYLTSSGQDVNLKTHLHLVSRLKMYGALPLILLYNVVPGAGTLLY